MKITMTGALSILYPTLPIVEADVWHIATDPQNRHYDLRADEIGQSFKRNLQH
jgi:hypothetical protein